MNGVPQGPITPSRGLRQMDPSSPYLFLHCAEGLVSFLKKAKNDGCLWGFRCVGVAHFSIISSLLMIIFYFVELHLNIIFRFRIYSGCMKRPLDSKLIGKKLQFVLAKILLLGGIVS